MARLGLLRLFHAHPGVSLVIATGSFPGTPAVTAALAYALFRTIVLALLALG